MKESRFAFAFEERPTEYVTSILSTIPARWGRMPPLSRAVVVEAAVLLRKAGLLPDGTALKDRGIKAGLIGGTRWGSLATDLAFMETMKDDPALASPAIFGYTLANIPLAEAANQFGLLGPVYAVIAPENPLEEASREAGRILGISKDIDIMLACEFDASYGREGVERLSVTFTLLERHDDHNDNLP